MALARGDHRYADVKPERCAIADDWHFAPRIRCVGQTAKQWRIGASSRTRMRQHIRDIAASRDPSDEEIKPVLKLKHQEIAEFRSI